jgi:hypothetical protein
MDLFVFQQVSKLHSRQPRCPSDGVGIQQHLFPGLPLRSPDQCFVKPMHTANVIKIGLAINPISKMPYNKDKNLEVQTKPDAQ